MGHNINPEASKSGFRKAIRCSGQWISILLICLGFFFQSPASASDNQGERVYKHLSDIANSSDSEATLKGMFDAVKALSWEGAKPDEFVGNLRVIRTDAQNKGSAVYLLRKLMLEVHLQRPRHLIFGLY